MTLCVQSDSDSPISIRAFLVGFFTLFCVVVFDVRNAKTFQRHVQSTTAPSTTDLVASQRRDASSEKLCMSLVRTENENELLLYGRRDNDIE